MNNYLKLDKLFDALIYYFKNELLKSNTNNNLKKLKNLLNKSLKIINKITNNHVKNANIVSHFCLKYESIINSLKKDLNYFYESDPAAYDLKDIVLSYPGFYAIIAYRLAHVLCDLNVEYLPRMLSEYAHSKTGIDIHPKAIIGDCFFIDHGTGIVIGETTIVGHHVKIYQNVTLGALSLKEGQNLKGIKRHPTIGNYVTIYAGATVLGGNTVIEDNVTIGLNVLLIKSVVKNSIIKI